MCVNIVYYATRAYSITLRTSGERRARVAGASARRSPEFVKKYARVAYVILCNFVWKVRYNECTHGDEKPPPPIRDAGYMGRKRGRMGRRSGSRGAGGGAPTLAEKYFFILEKKRKY